MEENKRKIQFKYLDEVAEEIIGFKQDILVDLLESTPPQMVLNHETGEYVNRFSKNLVKGIVEASDKGVLVEGYFTSNFNKNIFITYEGPLRRAISKDIFPKNCLFYNTYYGTYTYCLPEHYNKFKSLHGVIKGYKRYPYINIGQKYEATSSLKLFKPDTSKTLTDLNENVLKNFKYSFGLEFESSGGLIPEEECFKNGLIPLKDGSITGIEYATTVLSVEKNAFDVLKRQVDVLSEYTKYDKDCSLHIHFGGIPLTSKFICALYNVCYYLQNELQQYLPYYTFNTSAYKKNGKDYCKLLPDVGNFNNIYKFLSIDVPFLGDFCQPHPRDERHGSKWNIPTRYYWINFINACFYKNPKTIEFRFLRPTYNYNKIVNWLCIMNAILLYSENLSKEFSNKADSTMINFIKTKFRNEGLSSILISIYGENDAKKLLSFLNKLQDIINVQQMYDDVIGALDEVDDTYLTTNILQNYNV